MNTPIYKTNPHDEYELIQKIGSGTYGDVYKVSTIFFLSQRLVAQSKFSNVIFTITEIREKTYNLENGLR